LALNGGKEEFSLLEDEELITSSEELTTLGEEVELFSPQAVRMINIDMNNGNSDFFI
jgi:hypothetical protein